MRCYICRVQGKHLIRIRRDTNYIAAPIVHLCWRCAWAKFGRKEQ